MPIHPTAIIAETAKIAEDCDIGAYVIVEDDVEIGSGTRVWPHAFIGARTKIGQNNQIHPGAVIGHWPQDVKYNEDSKSGTIIGDGNIFREHSSVHRATTEGANTIVGNDGFYMAHSHIAHDCVVGDGVILVNGVGLAGHCEIGDKVIFSGFTGIHQFGRVGRLSMFVALSATNKDLPPFMIFGGRPAVCQGINKVGLRRAGIGRETRAQIMEAHKILYRQGLPVSDALAKIEETLDAPEVQEIVDFVRGSKRGICLGVADSDGQDTMRVYRKRTAGESEEAPQEASE